ncbi:MAG: S8 family serine peptidase, partial [Ignavibacteriaceae bacterium]
PVIYEDGILKSKRIVVAFNEKMFDTDRGISIVDPSISPIRDSTVKNLLDELSIKYGIPTIRKTIPNRIWEDSLVFNRRTKEWVNIPIRSQSFRIDFPNLIPLDSVIYLFRKIPVVRYAEQTPIIAPLYEPNDEYNAQQWYLDKIDAEEAWDITRGSNAIRVAIIDAVSEATFYDVSNHEDFQIPGGGNKFMNEYYSSGGDHTRYVAGVLGATTDNFVGISSLGWNVSLLTLPFHDGTEETSVPNLISQAYGQIVQGDIINMSFTTLGLCGTKTCPMDFEDIAIEILNAKIAGVIMVASAGNGGYPGCFSPCDGQISYLGYPASYPGVIGVSATRETDEFYEGYNFGPQVDISAPGDNIYTLDGDYDGYASVDGTSLAAPLVSALASLILSLGDFTSEQVEDIIKLTADKAGTIYQYDQNGNGRNDHMGYGRINAYNALLYARDYSLVTYGGTLTEDLIIPEGEVLNFIVPGVEVILENGASIIVEGTLSVQGTFSNNIIFKGPGASEMGGSIIFDGAASSNSVLNYAKIEYATDVQCLNGGDVTIQNSTIQNCTNGIYIYNSQPIIVNNDIIEPTQNGIYGEAPGMRPLIQDNVITRTSSQNFQGIWFANYTRPFITHNDVSGFHHAVYLGGGSLTIFSDDDLVTSNPNNRLINSLNGLNTGWGSRTFAGKGSLGANNSIYNNTYYDVKAYNNSTIWAQNNYWGGGQPDYYVDGSSFLNIDFILPIDPWEGPSAPISNQGDINELAKFIPESVSNPTDGSGSDIDDLLNGLILERDKKINEAVIHYKQMVNRDAFTRSALTSLASIANQFDRDELLDYFGQLLNDRADLKSTLLTLLAAMHLHRGNYVETLDIYDEIILENRESYEGVSARLDKFYAALNYGKDIRLASNIFRELESLNITEEELLTRFEFSNYLLNSRATLNKSTEFVNISTYDNKLPKEYSLSNNYPNPFNPTTIIEYSIKQDGLVSLKVYDVLGNEIVSLVNKNQVAGNYSIQFDASNLPSGIYIYRLTSGSFTSSKKLILLK